MMKSKIIMNWRGRGVLTNLNKFNFFIIKKFEKLKEKRPTRREQEKKKERMEVQTKNP